MPCPSQNMSLENEILIQSKVNIMCDFCSEENCICHKCNNCDFRENLPFEGYVISKIENKYFCKNCFQEKTSGIWTNDYCKRFGTPKDCFCEPCASCGKRYCYVKSTFCGNYHCNHCYALKEVDKCICSSQCLLCLRCKFLRKTTAKDNCRCSCKCICTCGCTCKQCDTCKDSKECKCEQTNSLDFIKFCKCICVCVCKFSKTPKEYLHKVNIL
jgi:hypothetical protein